MAEEIQFDLDPRSVMAAIRQMNTAVEGWEKGGVGANQRVQQAAERMADMLLKVNDRSRNSLERLTQSIEKQAAAYGKTGAERMIAERDRIIKKLGDEQGMIDRVTQAYAKMAAADASGAGGMNKFAGSAQEAKASLALMGEEIGVHIPRHIRGFIAMLPGVGQALEASFNAVAVIALIGVIYEVTKKVLEFRKVLEDIHEEPDQIRAAFAKLDQQVRTSGDELRATNARMEETLAKLQGRPVNGLKTALYDARVEADKLAESLRKDLDALSELLHKKEISGLHQALGVAGTSDITAVVDRLSRSEELLMAQFSERISKTKDPKEVAAIQQDFSRRITNLYENAQTQLKDKQQAGVDVAILPSVLKSFAQGQPGIVYKDDAARQAELKQTSATLRDLLAEVKDRIAGGALKSEVDRLQPEAARAAAIREMEQQFIKRMTEVEMGPVGKIFAERDDLVRRGARPEAISDAAISGAKRELAKEEEEDSKRNDAMKLLAGKSDARMWQEEVYKPLEASNAETIKQFKEMVSTQRQILDIGAASERSAITARASHAGRLAQLGISGPGQEMESIASAYQERMGLARDLYAFEMDRASKELEAGKRKVDQARAWAELQKETYDASVEQEIKIAELQKRRTDELAKTSASLWNTLLTKPGDFPKQLGGTIHAAVLRPITEGLGNMTANVLKPVVYGADGQSGIAGVFNGMFGGRQDPVKVATDQNTLATRQNSEALVLLESIIARFLGVSPSSLVLPSFLPGFGSLPHFADGGITRGPSIVGEAGPELVIPLDMRPTPYRSLVGRYGPETDAALQKAAMGMLDLALPAGLSALGGPAGFSLGEGLMSLILGGAAAATPPRHDNLMLGMIPVGGGGSRLQRMQAGEVISDEEMRLLFNQTPESLVKIGRKGGLASARARRLKALLDEGYDDSRYTGPEIDRETTHQAARTLDDQFPWLRGAFQKDEGFLARQERGRLGGKLGGGDTRSAAVRAARDMAAMRVRGSTAGSMLWAINPDTGGVRLAPYIPDDTKWSADLFATHADWFEQIKFPIAGPEFDRIPRGYARIDRGRLHITDNGIEETQEGLTSPPLTADQYRTLVERISKKFKLPSYDDGGTVAQTGMAVVHQGEAVVPSADTLKRSIDLNTAAVQRSAEAARASTAQMAMMAANITGWLLAGMGVAMPRFAAGGGAAGNVVSAAMEGPGAPGGETAGMAGVASVVGGPGGTSGFAGPVRMGGGGGYDPLATILGAGRQGSATGASGGGWAGTLKNLKSIKWGGLTRSGPTYGTDENGSDVQTGNGKITGVNGAAGAALFSGGAMLAERGLLGQDRGTGKGIAEGAGGGAMIGFQQGGPIGAVIGAGVGALIGVGEKLAGVESPENQAKRLARQIYSVSIDNSMAKQIVGIAQQKYAGNVGVAIRDPDVRKMLMLYSEATGQKMPLSATTPYGASLAESGGRLYQEATYQNGKPYTYQSGMPVLGGYQTGSYPTAAPMMLQVNVSGQGAAQFVAGQVVTPQFVQAQWSSAGAGSNGRTQNSAMLQQPGLVVS